MNLKLFGPATTLLTHITIGVIAIFASASVCGIAQTAAQGGDGQPAPTTEFEAYDRIGLRAVSVIDKIRWAAQAIVAPELLSKVMIVYVYEDVDEVNNLSECTSRQLAEIEADPCILGFVENPSQQGEEGVILRLQIKEEDNVSSTDNGNSQSATDAPFVTLDRLSTVNALPAPYWIYSEELGRSLAGPVQ